MAGEQSIVVLGGTGFVGRALAHSWKFANRPLTFLVHRTRPSWLGELGMSNTTVDLDNPGSITAALAGARVVVNLLRPLGDGWYPRVMDTVLPAMAAAGIVRCVHASSIDVYNGSDAVHVTADTPAAPRTPYELEHIDAEHKIDSIFAEHTILRLGAVFGPGGKNIVALAGEMAHAPRYKLIVRRALYGARRMHLVSLPTVCGALEAAILMSPKGPVVNVTDDSYEENNFGFVQDTLAATFGRNGLSGIPSSPSIALALLLRLKGLPPALARRRFASDGLDLLGGRRGNFVAEIERYAQDLARQPQDHSP